MRDKTQIQLEQAYQKVLLREYYNDEDQYNGYPSYASSKDPYEGYPPLLVGEITAPQGTRKFEEVDAKGNSADKMGSGYVRALQDNELDGNFKYEKGKVYKVNIATGEVTEHDAVSAHIQHQGQTEYKPALDAQGKRTGAQVSNYPPQPNMGPRR